MRNPPSALLLTLPLGFFGLRAGALLWSLFLLACLVLSVRMLWAMHGRPRNQLHWLGYTFAPALDCLMSGQMSLFVLLGLVLFLRLHRSRPFLAGASLWLCMLKPHLFLPFGGRAACVDHRIRAKQTFDWRGDYSRREYRDCLYPGSSCLDALWPDDERSTDRKGSHSMFQHDVAPECQPEHYLVAISTRGPWLRLGPCLLP